MNRVCLLDQVEVFGYTSLAVRQEREARAQPGSKRAIDLARGCRDHSEPTVLALNLVLHGYEPAQPHRFLGSPPTAAQREYERLARGDLRQPHGNTRLIRQLDVRERCAHDQIGPHTRSRGSRGDRSSCAMPRSPASAFRRSAVSAIGISSRCSSRVSNERTTDATAAP